jgi:hypothetical protein
MSDPLRARLAALLDNWSQREQQYRHLRPGDEGPPDTLRSCALELTVTMREPPASPSTCSADERIADVCRFLERIEHQRGANSHEWLLAGARRHLAALMGLREPPATSGHSECPLQREPFAAAHQHRFHAYMVCTECGETKAAIAGCHHCDEVMVGKRCWWCLRVRHGEPLADVSLPKKPAPRGSRRDAWETEP